MIDKRKEDLVKNTTLLIICTILNKAFGFLLIPMFSRWLTTEQYGTYDVLASYASLLVPVITIACADALFRFCLDKDADIPKYITNSISLIVFNIIVFGIIFLILNKFIQYQYFGFLYILLIAECVDNMIQGYLRGIKHLDVYGYCKAIGVVLIGGFTALLVLVFDMGTLGITLGYVLGYLSSDFLAVIITRVWKYIDVKKVSAETIKEMLAYSWVLVPNSLSWWVMNASDRLLISVFLDPAANGIYAITSKIPTVCSSVFSVFSITWQQTSAEMINDEDRDSYFNEVYNKMICLLVTLCAGIVSLNYFLFHIIFDISYIEGQLYAPILVTSAIFLSLSQYFGGIEIALKRPKENSITTIIGAAVNFAINIAFIKVIGLYAAAISTLIANIVVMFIRKNKLSKLIKIKTNPKLLLLIIYYIYMFRCSFLDLHITMVVGNIIVAGIVFMLMNYGLIMNIIKRLHKT